MMSVTDTFESSTHMWCNVCNDARYTTVLHWKVYRSSAKRRISSGCSCVGQVPVDTVELVVEGCCLLHTIKRSGALVMRWSCFWGSCAAGRHASPPHILLQHVSSGI